MKLRRVQIICLALSCMIYIGFLLSFLNSLSLLTLGCGVLMGIGFLLTIMLGLPKEDAEEDFDFDEYGYDSLADEDRESVGQSDDQPRDRVHVNSLIDQLAERREDLEAAQSDIKSKDEEIERLNKKIDDSKVELTEVQQQKQFLEEKVAALENSLKEARESNSSSEGKNGYETILPEAKDDTPIVINIGEAAKKAADDLKDAAEKAGITIRTVSTDATLMVKASPVMIDVLFKNIIDNAIKYMSSEGTLQITISRIEEELFIVMKDNGKGLAADETEHIFELNFQGSNRISGNGLGLAQARAIVEYYGGMIYARSNVGSGMGIYIHLPSAM